MNYYYLHDGTEVNREMIKQAYEEGKAVLIHTTVAGGGAVMRLMLDGNMVDTREQCSNVIDEVWSSKPVTLAQALAAAYSDRKRRKV